MENSITNYAFFKSVKSQYSEIQRPYKRNMNTGNYSVQHKDIIAHKDFYFDYMGEFGIIPFDVVEKHAKVMKTTGNNSVVYYLINKMWLEPYLHSIKAN
jgi:hypothetical protein